MLLGVISDTHGNLEGFRRAWELGLKDADIIFHCGDVLYHGPKFEPAPGYDPAGLAAALNDCGRPVIVARGNGDSDVDQLVLEMPVQQPYAFVVVDDLRLLVAHGHLMSADELAELAAQWGMHFVLTGHTHVPRCEKVGETWVVNPGTVTYPLAKEERLHTKSFALIRDGWPEVIELDTGEVLLS